MLPSISCANPFPPSSCLNQAVIWAPKCELATCDPCKSGNNLLHRTTCHDEGEIWGRKKILHSVSYQTLFIGLTVSPGFALINVTIIRAITMHQLSGLFSRSKVFHTAGGQVKSIFPRFKSIPSSEPGCQLLSATGPNARGPDSSNRMAGQKLPPIQRDLKNAASSCIFNQFHPCFVCLVTKANMICVTNI